MKNILITIIVIFVGIAGFYYYINSGTELNETLPINTEVNNQLSEEDKEHIAEMVAKAPSMTDKEKKEAEETIVTMLMEKEDDTEPVMEKMEKKDNTPSKKGSFTEVDFIHKGSGQALVFDNINGSPLLRLENFQVTRGPDLYVYLSTNTDIKSNGIGKWTSLGRLKSSKGNQNYTLPEDYEEYHSVVIWCQAFGVLFSEALLK